MVILEQDNKAEQQQDPLKTEKNKEVKSVFELNINKIFAALHVKAFEQASKVDGNYKIQNSAIEGNENKATFYGAGKHIIGAIPLKGEAEREKCLEVIKTYVQWFSGPDFANKLTTDSLFPLQTEDTEKEKIDKSQNESKKLPSFYTYITEEVNTDSDTNIEFNKIEESSKDNNKEDNKKEKTDIDSTTAKGFYITYQIQIKGQKEHPLTDALKKFAADVLKNFGLKLANKLTGMIDNIGVQEFSFKSGLKGNAKHLNTKKVLDKLLSLKDVFGKINANELQSNYEKNIKIKYPKTNATSTIFDTKTLQQKCKKWLSSKDKAKLKDAEYAICTRVEKSDATYKFFNPQFIADTLTKSITGLFKKFKNKVPEDMVIHINNYDDNAQNKNRKEGEVADSQIIKISNSLIFEENNTNKKDAKKSVDKTAEFIQFDEINKILQDAIKVSNLSKEKEKYQNMFRVGMFETKVLNEQVKKEKYQNVVEIDTEKFSHALCIKLFNIKVDKDGNPITTESNKTLFNYIYKALNESKNYKDSEIEDIFKQVFDKVKLKADKIDKLHVFTKIFGPRNKQQKESLSYKNIISQLFEDIILEEEPTNEKDSKEKTEIIEQIQTELKTVADSEVKTAQIPFDLDENETKVWNSVDLIKTLKENGISDSDTFSTLQKYKNTLAIKLSKKTGSQDDKSDAIEDRSEDDEQLGTGESVEIKGNLLIEARNTEQLKKQLLDVGKKIFDKVTSKFKSSLIAYDIKNIINVEYENPSESIYAPSFDKFILEKSNKDKSRDHITNEQAKELINLIKQKGLKNIQDNFKEVEEKWGETKPGQSTFSFDKYETIYTTVKNMLKDTADKAEDNLITYINSAIHDKSDDAKKKKIVLTRLIPAIKNIKEKEENNEITITFRDIDDPSKIDDFTSLTSQDKEKYKQLGEPIKTEPGKDVEAPEVPEKKGYKFDRWDPDPKEMKEDGYTYAIYQELDNEQPEQPEEENEEGLKSYQYLILPVEIRIKQNTMTKIYVQAFNANNNMKAKIDRTDTDFYIVPMKGLTLKKSENSKKV